MDNTFKSACLIKQALKNSELSKYVEFKDIESDNNGYGILEMKDNDKCNEVLSFIESELSKIQSDPDLHSRISEGTVSIVSIGKDYVPENESVSIQEKVSTGTTIPDTMPEDMLDKVRKAFPDIDSQQDIDLTIHSKDGEDSIIHTELEKFNKKQAELLLESKDIVNEYKLYIDGRFDDIVKNTNKNSGIETTISELYNGLTSMGIDSNDVKRYVINTFFNISDEPKVIRKALQLRLNYNKKITSMLQKMLQINYSQLGLTSQEAIKLISKLSSKDSNLGIKDVKEIINKNKSKFIKGNIIDLSSIGFGKAFMTNDLGGLEVYTHTDSLLQYLMRYDVVCITHGGDDKNAENGKKWYCLPIKTDKAGPFTDVNDLCRELIKEGYKKIMLICCNPGHYELEPDVKNTKGVIIKHAINTQIMESNNNYEELLEPITEENNYYCPETSNIEIYLKEVCERNNIDYYDNDTLYENYLECCNINDESINEGVLTDLCEFARKVLQFIIFIFKKIIAFFKSIIEKIKGFITGGDKGPGVVASTSYITLESASVKETKINNLKELQDNISKACEKIGAEINKRGKIQVSITEEINKDLKKRSINESTEETITETKVNKKDAHPVYLITSFTYNTLGKIISKNSDISKCAISLDPNIDKMYTFITDTSEHSGELRKENLKDYMIHNKNSKIQLSVIFLKSKDFNKLKSTIEYIADNRGKYSDSSNELINVIFRIPKVNDYQTICSEFINRVFYAIKLDIPDNKSLSLVNPKDIYKLHVKNAKIYNIYDGLLSDYNKNDITKMIDSVFNDVEYVKESGETILPEKMCILETKEFPIDFDEQGNIIIKNYKKLNFEAEYSASHKLLKIYEDTNNYEGMKYELSKLWFMNNVLEKRIYSNPTEKELQAYCKVRARILNDFNKYLKLIVNHESNFNFTKYYNDSPFSDVKIKISGSLISGLSNLLKQVF